MTTITLEVPDGLAAQLTQLGDRLPEVLLAGLRGSTPLPAHVYRYILDFLAGGPTSEQVAAFRPTPEMQARLETLLTRNRAGQLTPIEAAELDEYERIEHLIVMLKAGNLPHLTGAV
jgi:hypothetical protein